jgi:predicted O-methyltransferase YrrM
MPYNVNIIGWMTEPELQSIESIANDVPENGVIVELGSMFGRSSVCWALSAPTATVYCVDRFRTEHMEYNTNFEDQVAIAAGRNPLRDVKYHMKNEFTRNTRGISNIVMIEGESPNIDYPGDEIDVFFLDAEHNNPNDWDNLCHFIPMIKEGGIVCGHDMYVFPDVTDNVTKLEKLFNTKYTSYEGGTIWSFKLPRKITKEELQNEL